jgi:hypothetical protein
MYVDIYNLSEERGVTFDVARIRMQGKDWLEFQPHGWEEWETLAVWSDYVNGWLIEVDAPQIARAVDFDVSDEPSGLFPIKRMEASDV